MSLSVELTGSLAQVPVIDHCVPHTTNEFGAAIEASSLNLEARQRKQGEIAFQNLQLLRRLQTSRPTYERGAQLRDWRERERWLQSKRIANRPLIFEEVGRGGVALRPMSATAATRRRRPASASSISSMPVRRPDRPRTAAPKGPPKPSAPIDPKVADVLALLSSQMKNANSLAQARSFRAGRSPPPIPSPTSRIHLSHPCGLILSPIMPCASALYATPHHGTWRFFAVHCLFPFLFRCSEAEFAAAIARLLIVLGISGLDCHTQVRQKRDTLLDSVYSMPQGVEAFSIPKGRSGVPIEIVKPTSAACDQAQG